MPHKTIVLSIIIVHYKTRELTLQCLRSLREFGPKIPYEILLIDNDSRDGIGDAVAKEFPEVRLMEPGRNDGFGPANNLGIANSRGQYICLLNSDTKLIEPIFDTIVQLMEARPDLGCIGPRHFGADGLHQVSYGKFPSLLTEIRRKILDRRISRNDAGIRKYLDEFCAAEKEVDWLSGSCLLVRRDALRQTGLLDESFFMYFEDMDLCKRIKERGWKIAFYPKLKMVHLSGQSVKKNKLTGLAAYRQSQLYFARKHYGCIGDCFVRGMLLLKFTAVTIQALAEFQVQKILGRDVEAARIKMLLSQKVFGMIFQRHPIHPREPALD
jgi:hypothetical protein